MTEAPSFMVHVVAGAGALVMGLAVLLRGPARPRHRSFAMLCGALALWNLGVAGRLGFGPPRAWTVVLMLGSCAAPPLALDFAARLAGWTDRARRRAAIAACLPAAALWLVAWSALPGRPWWPWASIVVLGGISALALGTVARRAWMLPPGPERRALAAVFWGGLVAVGGGLTDFLPRADSAVLPELGPLGVLVFLFVVAAVVVRHRFLDVDLYLLRIVTWIVAATGVALAFSMTLALTGEEPTFSLLLLVALVVVGLGWTLGAAVWGGARALLGPADPVTRALGEASASLPLARRPDDVWEVVAGAAHGLPGRVGLAAYWRGADEEGFQLRGPVALQQRSPGQSLAQSDASPVALRSPLGSESALPSLLLAERAPLTRGFLERERGESRGDRARLVEQAIETFRHREIRLVVPLLRGERLAGWIELRGDLPERYQTAEIAAAFTALGHQAADAFERIAAEETARRHASLAAVGELAAGLAHEVRNPVAAIRGAAQALGPQATPEQRREMLEVIGEETERLGRVVGEFLDYARPASPRRERVDLGELVQRVAQGAALAGWRLRIEVRVRPGAPAAAGDPDQLRRVFENLTRNAWEATGESGRLVVEIRPEGVGRVAARFEDDGPGIPAERLAHLFVPFHTTKPGGTGLGLALVHRVVEAHGGEVRVEGRPGAGAAFTVVLDAFA